MQSPLPNNTSGTDPAVELPQEENAGGSGGLTGNAQQYSAVDPDDDPALDEEKGPNRRCAVTREHGRPDVMLRFVVSPDRVVIPDLGARLPGRGIWLSARRDVLETARTRGGFARAARGQVTIPPDLAKMVEDGLFRRMVEILGLARRAGQGICGFAKVREWIVAGQVGLIVQAMDGSPEECARLLSGARDLPVVSALPASVLGHVFGREHVVHAAVRPGALAHRLLCESERFAGMVEGPVSR